MSDKLTYEQLNQLPKEALVTMILSMQKQLDEMNGKLDHLMEQIALANNYRFGRHTEKLKDISGQGSFDAEGRIYFNEAEAILDRSTETKEPELETVIRKRSRPKGKKEMDLADLPVMELPLIDVPEEERIRVFGSLDNCRRMDDEVLRRLVYIPAGFKVEETHVAVYRSCTDKGLFLKGETPAYLLRGSIVSPSLEAAIMNAKYVNAQPLRRIEKDFEQKGICISEQNMASWTIKCALRYLVRIWNYLHLILLTSHVVQADESTVEVSKDGRKAGSISYMWVYRTGQFEIGPPIVLYEFQKTRKAQNAIEFLAGFAGYLVCDGYPGYKVLGRSSEGITIAECWAHARRKFSDAVTAAKAPARAPETAKIATDALQMIAAISHAEGKLKDLSADERLKERTKTVRPLVDAFFAWVHMIADDRTTLLSDKTREGIQYCLNQEKYLYTFLEDGAVPMDNNKTEGTIRGFAIGRKNWMMIDTVSGAKASAIIYSIVETAKANGLNTYRYLEYLLTELPKLKEFSSQKEEAEAMERLVPWAENLPEICRLKGR